LPAAEQGRKTPLPTRFVLAFITSALATITLAAALAESPHGSAT
jgi:hypothetical protein